MSRTPTKIEKLGTKAEMLVWQGKAADKGYRRIADDVNEAYADEEVSHMAVKNYIENAWDERKAELGVENLKEIRKQEFEQVLDTASQLEKLNGKLQEAIETLDPNDRTDMGMLNNLAKEVRQQIKLHEELLNNMTQPKIEADNVEVNKTQIAMKVVNKLNDLEEEGIIEIKKPEKLAQKV